MAQRLPTLHFFRDEKRHPQVNMAMDEALHINDLNSVIRFYGWDTPAVSMGYFCSWRESIARHGKAVEYVRRWTGGGTVEHGTSDITYSISLPTACDWGKLRSSQLYEKVHSALSEALQQCGIDAEALKAGETTRDSACFEHPVAQDLVISGRKVAGAAIRRTARGILLQGSIQHVDLPDQLPEVFAGILADDIVPWNPGTLLDSKVEELVQSRYGQAHWTQRK